MITQSKKLTRKEKIAAGVEKLEGNRRARSAAKRKEASKSEVRAVLRNYPTSPRKMRYVADVIRGKGVGFSLHFLTLSQKSAARPLRKLLLSAINNFEQKYGSSYLELENLYVKTIMVDGGTILKRLRPAPQGRAYQIKKRSNHVTIIIGHHNPETLKLRSDANSSSTDITQA